MWVQLSHFKFSGCPNSHLLKNIAAWLLLLHCYVNKAPNHVGFDSYLERENTHPNFFSPEPNIVEFTRSTKSHRLFPAQLNSLSFLKTARKTVSINGEIR